MSIKIKLGTLIEWIMLITAVILATAGSVFNYIPLLYRILIVGVFWITIVFFIVYYHLRCNIYTFGILLLCVIFLIKNEYFYRGFNYYFYILWFISLLLSVVVIPYCNKFPDNLVKIMLFMYFLYAICTIWFFIDKGAYINIAVNFFNRNGVSMLKAYSRGCMTGFTSHYSINGIMVGMATIISGCYLCKCSNAINRMRKIGLFLICLVALLLVGKRAHTIFTVAALLSTYYVFMCNKPRKRLIRVTLLIITICISLIIIVNYIPALSTFIMRFKETSEAGDITLGRTQMWQIAWEQFLHNPLFGIGWGRVRNINIIDTGVHNIYIQLLAETGIVGTFMYTSWFLYMLTVTIKLLVRVRKGKTQVLENEEWHLCISLSVQVFFILYGFSGNPLTDQNAFTPYFLFQGIVLYYKYREKSIQEGHSDYEKDKCCNSGI